MTVDGRALSVQGTLPRRPVPPLMSSSAAYLAWYLDRQVFAPSATTFTVGADAIEVEVGSAALARAAVSVRAQLRVGDHGHAWLGGRDEVVLEATGRGDARVIRLLRGKAEALAVAGDGLLAAIAAMWRDHGGKVARELGCDDAVVAEVFTALTAGLGDDPPPGPPLPVAVDELLGELVPDVAAELAALATGTDGRLIWRGPRPDLELSPIERALGWLRALGGGDGFFVIARPGRFQLWSRQAGRTTQLDEPFDPFQPAAAIARLRFAWHRRAAFADGLVLVAGALAPMTRPRLAPDRALVLVPDDESPHFLVEPRPTITIGRDESNDLFIGHRMVARRQSLLTTRADGWYLADADSTAGTWLADAQVRAPTLLHQGDRLRLGGLPFTVWQPL